MQAGIIISGINAEVMPGQWEFQIGPVGPLEVGDQVHLARWLLHRLGENFGIVTTFNPKPVRGDWNGAAAPPALWFLRGLPSVLLHIRIIARAGNW